MLMCLSFIWCILYKNYKKNLKNKVQRSNGFLGLGLGLELEFSYSPNEYKSLLTGNYYVMSSSVLLKTVSTLNGVICQKVLVKSSDLSCMAAVVLPVVSEVVVVGALIFCDCRKQMEFERNFRDHRQQMTEYKKIMF